MRRKIIIIIALILYALPIFPQCSIFAVSNGEKILIGNNEDYGPAKKRIWINPSEQGNYGTIMFGFDEGYNNYEGGVNDQGLFIDGAAINPTDWVSNSDKDSIPARVLFKTVLGKCKNYEDVEQLANNFNIPSLKTAQFFVADKDGKCGVLIYHEKKQQLIKMQGDFQIVTNFHYGNGPDPYMPERRYNIGYKMLKESKYYSIEGFEQILFALHQNGRYENPTSYSSIYDLKNNKIYVYNFYNFFEPYIIDMNKIFEDGEKVVNFSDVFKSASFVSETHYATKLIKHMVSVIKEKGFNNTIANISELEKEYSMSGSLCGLDYATLGYKLVKEKMFSEAIEVFSYNIKKYPNYSGDNYAYMAETYLISKDTTNAIKYYKIALENNPKYEKASAIMTLEKLEK